MITVLIGRDLITSTRIADEAQRQGATLQRIDTPYELPAPGSVGLILVDWDARRPDWGARLSQWRSQVPSPPQIVLFGPHRDIAAHEQARSAGLGPMWARSRLFSELPRLLSAD